MTFNDAPQLVVRFTSDTEVLAGGLAGLVAEGETALYDSVIFALHYLAGGSGKRAVVVLTDGEDSSSTYTFEDAINFARHTGVAIYVIGLGLPSDPQARSHVSQLATETGGDTYFIDRVDQLGRVYDGIQQELRSQYLIGYQSSNSDKPADQFRRVEVRVDRKGVEAKTIRGYFP
jgi:Ca-activated chloride channel family protein